jgi:DNA-binding Lrp family transcriptional regulator
MTNTDSIAKLDDIDRQLLHRLDRNSRCSIAELSRAMNLGRDRITYRLERLYSSGVLKACTTTINPYQFGVIVYKTYLQVENNPPRIAQFLKFLSEHPRVYWLAECDGRWNVMIAVFARTPKEFHSIQDDILSQFSDIIIGLAVYTLIDVWNFRKRYFIGNATGNEWFFFGGPPGVSALDEIDFNVLRIMASNARIPTREIARQLDTTPTVIDYRIRKLEERGIILGYRTEIDLGRVGMTFFKTQLYLSTFDPREEDRILDFCKLNSHVATFIKQIGDCKVELELEVTDYYQLNRILDELRQRFPRLIRNIEVVMIKNQHFRWVPFDIVRTDGNDAAIK